VVGEPGDRTPAPGSLSLVQAFVNTIDREHAVDDLASPRGLADWLVAHELCPRPPRVTAADLADAVALREGLRALLLANNGERLPPAAVADVNRVAARCPLAVTFAADGAPSTSSTQDGVWGGLAQVLAAAQQAALDGTWPRLKACQAEICRWAFYDRSKNRSSHWCSMSLCGARSKVRAFRARTRK
jgi:predicted RNA-binding Zn ribbon-like protein